ncbi:helix-turn-helix transcriptional regulator [Bacteroides nordii]|uniref:helix-turn-helix transcriptional regulator n=1 Tax=Bacteroides nordii TaxID=291645 RepID=UPI002A816DC2|nr:helix-turn-helix transcriptional regulator [Bacteroides nordii]
MELKIIYPSSEFTPFIKYYWVYTKNYLIQTVERDIPKGCVQLIFYRKNKVFSTLLNDFQPRAFVEGQMSSYWDLRFEGDIEIVAILFTPQGAQSFLSTPIEEFYNKNISIECFNDKLLMEMKEAVMDAEDNMECIKIIEYYLLKKLSSSITPKLSHEIVIQKIESDNNVSITQLSNVSNLCHRQFHRKFVQDIGISPKLLTRIIRFQKMLSILQARYENNLNELAFRCGYFDASHLVREFKEFTGYTPNEYMHTHDTFSNYFVQKELILNKAYDRRCID